MSLFPTEDILTKEIESWRSFAASLNSEEYREIFNKMLSDCYKYASAINAKGEPFPTGSTRVLAALTAKNDRLALCTSI